MKTELLAKALADLDFLIADLRELNRECTPIEYLVVLPMLQKTAQLRADLRNLEAAVEPEVEP